jgi:ribulose 1,5-bisphosphate synthetase/thiazole synthase
MLGQIVAGCIRSGSPIELTTVMPVHGNESPGEAPRTATLDVVVVGAGIAGLTAARALASAGSEVLVLDKGRGPGGRASTRCAGEHAAILVAAWRGREKVTP